jgi:hypothetical protein
MKEKKSVDRDLVDSNWSPRMVWGFSYVWAAIDFAMVLIDSWKGYLDHGASFYELFAPVVYLMVLVSFFGVRRYFRSALSENLITERVARNCDYYLGQLFLWVCFAISFIALNH